VVQRRIGSKVAGLGLILVATVPLAASTLAGRAATIHGSPVTQFSSARAQPLLARHAALKQRLSQFTPIGHYIVVDTAHNRLYVKRGNDTVLTAVASTGSGTILEKPDQPGSQWVFDTPRGGFAIQSRLTNPVWVKPDWAFLEEGINVPTNPAERVEPGILGEYALGQLRTNTPSFVILLPSVDISWRSSSSFFCGLRSHSCHRWVGPVRRVLNPSMAQRRLPKRIACWKKSSSSPRGLTST
jgi:L,D-transpeptidase ErfK/SrfK